MSRLSVEFILDLIAIRRGGRQVIDMLLMVAILQANLAEITRRADLQVAYAEPDDIPPDELRRPISLSALANSLGLPFETVRRRIKALAVDGLCRVTAEGVIVPAAVLASPENQATGMMAYDRIRRFYGQLADAGLLDARPPPTVIQAPDATPLRTVGRLIAAYVLRVVETLQPVAPDVLDRVIFLEVFRENVEHLPMSVAGGQTLEARDMTPNAARKPVPVLALAHRLGMPPETVRRRVTSLIGAGLCARVKGGVIVPAEALGRPEVGEAIVANAANLQRLFAALAQLGILRIWDSSRPDTTGAAGALTGR